ncbi:hypothetical protein NM208_g8737 [Fusarium decemcellulare]|uniref:Uncharacterized protein n=1 Tax=Fusarium decemcellulare TaxID=57161 RepID=A0ACC1S474_9HYPO|nr:hypothetical protein NM208_g8737 [Fusarium decemcellulare]
MPQSFLIWRNERLEYEEAERECRLPVPPSSKEWLKSELDNIERDLFDASADRPASEPRLPRYSRRYRRWYQNQYRLINLDGVMAIQRPQLGHPGSSETATGPESKRNHGPNFLSLPIEIRLCIYRYLLISDCCASLCPDPKGFRIFGPDRHYGRYGLHPQILAACCQINREATSILYSENLFERESFWRTKYTRFGNKLWPRSDSSPLTTANLECITRVGLFRGAYKPWVRGRHDLKVLREFPSLKELSVSIDLSDWSSDSVDLPTLWRVTIAAASRHRPSLTYFSAQLRLAYDQDYIAWCDRCAAKKELDYSYHRAKKAQTDRWIHSEQLFQGRELAWTFTTQTYEEAGPSLFIGFTIDSGSEKTQTDKILCVTEGIIPSKSLEPV